jgi:hypothetical protein
LSHTRHKPVDGPDPEIRGDEGRLQILQYFRGRATADESVDGLENLIACLREPFAKALQPTHPESF